MIRTVEFHDEARIGALQARAWYAARSSAAADAFIVELERAISSVLETPAAWSPYLSGTRRYLLRRFPYSVVYRVTGEKVEVVAVAHQRRRPGYWRGR